MRIPRNSPFLLVLMMPVVCLWMPARAAEGLRRIRAGEAMPEFSLAGDNGNTFDYKHERARVLAIVVLQVGESNLERVMTDVRTVAQEVRSESPVFDCVAVISGPGADEFVRVHGTGSPASFLLASDPNFAFWGKLGVIAAPTAVVVGSDGKVQWARAGYGYDFIAGLHAQLRKALGLAGDGDTSVRVQTLENTSDRARRERHIQLARVLAGKGRTGSAADELQKAYDLDPGVTEVALELGEMLCRAGRNEAALKIAEAANVKTNAEKAHMLSICGWARRQMKQLDAAESLLANALELNPRSARTLYELGRVRESTGDVEMALVYYRRALAEVFGETP